MSGGHWNYQEMGLPNEMQKLPAIIKVVSEALHIVDYAICGDTSRKNAEKELFDLFENLGEELWGE